MDQRRSSIDPINDRIGILREESVKKEVEISSERGELITEFYKNTDLKNKSIPVQRALAFKHLMEHVSTPVEDGQLIVGIRGTGVKEVPTYPEVCCHKEEDLEVLDSREKNPYDVEQDTRDVYRDSIIPFWKGETIRERIFEEMTKEWKEAYEAGVFTEFMEQRVPGHTSGGEKIFNTGLLDIKKRISNKKEELNSKEDIDKLEELKAMEIVADAMVLYAGRYADKLEKMAEKEKDREREEELRKMASICKKVPKNPPDTFWEALQHYWFIHVGITTESNPWDSFNPGRLDQHLYPFYEKEVDDGELDRYKAKELLQAFWLKFNNQPAPPKVGVTAQESNTYNDFAKINIGGVQKDGSDGVNEVSHLLLETLDEMRTLQPNTAVLISKKNVDRFLNKALKVVKPGFGEPPFFNHDEIIKILLRQGKSLKDARVGGVSGCVETGAFGKESYILTGYFNLPKVLEITLNNGIDPRTGNKIGLKTGEPSNFDSYEDLKEAFKKQLQYFIDIKQEGNDLIETIYHDELPVPFLSLWIEDCVTSAKDYNSGGARYNTQYIQIVGLGTITDSLSSLKYNVFDEERYDLGEVLSAIRSDFKNDEKMRQMFLNRTPRYGNDDDYADDIAKDVFDTCIDMVEDYPTTPVRNASRRVYGLPTTVHVYFGSVCDATPDGRKAGKPLSEGISPVQGADRKGIGAVFRSIGKLDHVRSGGTLLNQKLSPDLVQDEETRRKLGKLMRSYFKMDSHHVQYNVVSADLLREAQDNPNEFSDLMVRVAGYSDYFVNLPEGLQEEIIERTEQNEF
ncbi:MAG: glycyl radical protein [Candidatus Thermoplasmatota archaeon]|nr:glycyl radical protein [Candidatus Thermoplasmatota archaeon]